MAILLNTDNMLSVKCPIPDCPYDTPESSEGVTCALSAAHSTIGLHMAGSPRVAIVIKGPKLERPKVNIGVTLEEWNIFKRRWDVFVSGSGLDPDPADIDRRRGRDHRENVLRPADVLANEAHHIFTKGQWRRARVLNHPEVKPTMSVNASDYHAFRRSCPIVAQTDITRCYDRCIREPNRASRP